MDLQVMLASTDFFKVAFLNVIVCNCFVNELRLCCYCDLVESALNVFFVASTVHVRCIHNGRL